MPRERLILESIYMCSTSKSHRGSKDREIVRFGEDESHIKLNVLKHGMKYRIDMHLKKNKTKGIAVNGIPIKKAVELFGIINIVFFSPEDLNIIKNILVTLLITTKYLIRETSFSKI